VEVPSEPVIGMKKQRGGIPPHGHHVRGSIRADVRKRTRIRTPLRHPAEAVHTHRREPKKQRLPEDYCHKYGQEMFAQTLSLIHHRPGVRIVPIMPGSFFEQFVADMSAPLKVGYKSTSHTELEAGVGSGLPDLEPPTFSSDRGQTPTR
jgi:hypothetical protein